MIYFNTRETEYKQPFGALRAGEPLYLKMVLEGEPSCRRIRAVFRFETGENETGILEKQGETNTFAGTMVLQTVGLCFYRFEAEKEDGSYLFIGTADGVHAAIGDWLPEWRLTVYDRNFNTPEELAGGIWYQIFPDRFYKKEGLPVGEIRGKRIYHENWSERPLFTQDRPDFAGNDFFGGNLPGITEKLPYLKELGVDLLYLNPIFESGENHRYSTADYEKIDPLLGTNKDFEALCREAEKLGIRIVLDGVFSHTGANSRYFNKEGLYPDLGAYQSPDSPYYHWYDFREFPDKYDCWWGFDTLPCVKELSPDFMDYISGENGIAKFWMDKGAYGWRLDVADELPDGFLEAFRKRVKSTDPNSIIIGEVWENAVEKVSYGARRKFLLGSQCDTVMNYPWLNAILHLLKTKDTHRFYSQVMELMESYPPPALRCLMNILSTHDTPRFLNRLAVDTIPPRAAQADNYLSADQRETALALMKKAAILQFTLPGIPCIFYGDEIGMEGYGDPYCRGTFPWDGGERELLSFYKKLGALRQQYREAFKGDCVFRSCKEGKLILERGNTVRLIMNFSDTPMETDGIALLAENAGDGILLPGGFGWYRIRSSL
ncbi:MAG: glycoside hydrolase family 13 protein [Clostridia bacterium]|nr:glycoside hydrolase family 13 protein [Clostridia bacterium]MBQ8600821.1 glycoside hydrolase family 13 protein [Clostridia bacterium]